MGFLSKIGTWLFGGGGAEMVAKTVDEAVYSAEERSEDDAKDLASARSFAGVSNQPGFVNQVVDATNRLIRPGVTLWLCGGFIGWWTLPKPGFVDPYWQNVFMIVLTFWFGGRALLKDLPAAVRAMRGMR